MKEFEAKGLLDKIEFNLPKSILVKKNIKLEMKKIENLSTSYVIKSQLLFGNRMREGGIIFCEDCNELEEKINKLFLKKIYGQEIEEILIEEKVEIEKEYYFSISIDTKIRRPILLFSKIGGSGVEEKKNNSPEVFYETPINILNGIQDVDLKLISNKLNIKENNLEEFFNLIKNLYKTYISYDLKLLEINPLALTKKGFYIVDCKMNVDENALSRQNLNITLNNGFKSKSRVELEANKIDEENHRGVAGKTYLDLDGDIAFLASGGGGSMLAIDSLIQFGGKPANYTEYSGNPPSYKVKKLAELVLAKKNLSGVYIVGGYANFTSIYGTLLPILEVFIEKNLDVPIVIRRDGGDFFETKTKIEELAKENNLDVTIYDSTVPISLSAKKIVEKSKKYKGRK